MWGRDWAQDKCTSVYVGEELLSDMNRGRWNKCSSLFSASEYCFSAAVEPFCFIRRIEVEDNSRGTVDRVVDVVYFLKMTRGCCFVRGMKRRRWFMMYRRWKAAERRLYLAPEDNVHPREHLLTELTQLLRASHGKKWDYLCWGQVCFWNDNWKYSSF